MTHYPNAVVPGACGVGYTRQQYRIAVEHNGISQPLVGLEANVGAIYHTLADLRRTYPAVGVVFSDEWRDGFTVTAFGEMYRYSIEEVQA